MHRSNFHLNTLARAGLLALAVGAAASAQAGSASFTTVGATSWQVPAGVTQVRIVAIGGGGGGGGGGYGAAPSAVGSRSMSA